MAVRLRERVPPARTPVSLREFAADLRMASGFAEDRAEDALLEMHLRAAVSAIEAQTGLPMIEREMIAEADGWDGDGGLTLGMRAVARVLSVAIVEDGAETVLEPGAWHLFGDRIEGEPHLPRVPRGAHVRVTFVAGLGPDANAVPPALRQAVSLLARHFFDGEGGMPGTVRSLIAPWRVLRV